MEPRQEPLNHDAWQAITLAEREGKLNREVFAHRVDPITVHIAPDIHWPYHRADVLSHIIDLCHGVDIVIQIGDGNDCYGLSDFDKDPGRESNTQKEADEYREGFWRPIRHRSATVRCIQIMGNHEERFDRYVRRKAPGLASVHGLTWAKVLNVNKYNVELHPRSGLLIAGQRIKHGDVARSTGNNARNEMDAHRADGISAHTHRWEYSKRTDKEGRTTEWRSIGHACDVDKAEYVKNPDWHLSAGLGLTIYPDGHIDFVEHRL